MRFYFHVTLHRARPSLATAGREKYERRALAIYTAVAGAQLIARTRLDIRLFDELILSYQEAGLIPA